jgi:hypothetical protein
MPARYDIFLSYSRADTALVAPLRDELRRLGYRVFFDTQSIEPGELWKTRLERSIKNSRTLVLCWSEHTRGSDYITFEYSRAEALHKPILPWLLDKTPLPAMLEVQAITTPDAIQAAAQLRPALGATLSTRRRIQSALAIAAFAVLAIAAWFFTRPPPPWQLQGKVTDFALSPLAGVGVDVVSTQGGHTLGSATTDATGAYTLPLPQPKPDSVLITFHKTGYTGEQLTVSTAHPFTEQLQKSP